MLLGLGVGACADDIPAVPTTESETGTTTGSDTLPPPDGTTTTTTGVDTTETASTTETVDSTATTTGSTGSTSTGETEGTTGEPTLPGHTVSQLVSAGTRTASRSYTLVHTLGQPSPLQSTHESTSYRLQGGLVGANGSPP
jgi:hypothetical protein